MGRREGEEKNRREEKKTESQVSGKKGIERVFGVC